MAQVLKLFPFAKGYWDWSDGVALGLGLGLWALGRGQAIDRSLAAAVETGQARARGWLLASALGMVLLALLLKAGLGETRTYRLLLSEGGFIEYGTFLLLGLTGIFALPIAQQFYRQGSIGLSFLYYAWAGLMFMVAMEEVSWGQMLAGWQGGDFFQVHNSQQETNLHNLRWVNRHVEGAIALASTLGTVACGLHGLRSRQARSRRVALVDFLLPDWSLGLFFCAPLLFYGVLWTTGGRGWLVSGDQEFAELLLVMGFLLATVSQYLKQVR